MSRPRPEDKLMTAFARYPLVEKALAEQRAIFVGSEDGVPADLAAATARTLFLLDTHVPDSNADKEYMLTVGVLMHCPPYMALKRDRFAADYHLRVQAMLDVHTKSAGVTAANIDLVQVYSAMFIAHAENLQLAVNAATAADRAWLRDIRDSLRDYAEDREVFVKGILPGLREIESNLLTATLATLDVKLAPTPKPPKPPKTPKPPARRG